MRWTKKWIVVIVLCLFSGGCAVYRSRILPSAPHPVRAVADVTVDTSTIALPGLRNHRFEPADGLDAEEVEIFAVVNNPGLRLARDDVGVARAQAFAAGLLPDPQLSLSTDVPAPAQTGTDTAYGVGLSWDVNALLTRRIAVAAATADVRKIDLTLLWKEWQVMGEARRLFLAHLVDRRRLDILEGQRGLLEARFQRMREALSQGNVTVDAVNADRLALVDIDRRIADLRQQALQNRYGLYDLLGLSPRVRLKLTGTLSVIHLDAAAIRAAVPKLLSRRPDLLALRAGTRSQDLRYRQAILEQFPALNIGVSRARDTSDVYTVGLAVTVGLPFFNRNRGNIAVAEATRKRLDDEFRIRLDQSETAIEKILGERRLLEQRLAMARQDVRDLERRIHAAADLYKRGTIDEMIYINLRTAAFNRQLDALNIEQRLDEQDLALETLLGFNIPSKGK